MKKLNEHTEQRNAVLSALQRASTKEQEVFLNWAKALIAISNSNDSKAAKVKTAFAVTKSAQVTWPMQKS